LHKNKSFVGGYLSDFVVFIITFLSESGLQDLQDVVVLFSSILGLTQDRTKNLILA
jgi:hypothetical protein